MSVIVTGASGQLGHPAMLHIDIWADFACPACYLAKPRIDQAIAASGHADAITVTYRSFELFPDAGPEPFDSFEHVLHKFGGDQAQAAHLEEHMAALARAQGQPYAVRADEKLAREVGVTAVPFTILGGRLAIPGAATADAYADAITQALTTGDPQ